MISSALYLVPVLDCLSQSNSELTVALQDLGNPGGNDNGSGGFGDDDHHHDDDDDDDDDDDGKNEDAAPVEHCLDFGLWQNWRVAFLKRLLIVVHLKMAMTSMVMMILQKIMTIRKK